LHDVPVNVPDVTGTHCTYPQMDGQAELTSDGHTEMVYPAADNRPTLSIVRSMLITLSHHTVIFRAHSFSRIAEFRAEPQNLPLPVEF